MNEIRRELEELAMQVWPVMFGDQLGLCLGGEVKPGPVIDARVSVTGPHVGDVVIRVPVPLAAALTAAMLGSSEEPGVDDILDAMGELCNTIAGNVKPVIFGSSRLSPPVAVLDPDGGPLQRQDGEPPDDGIESGAPAIGRATFTCDGHAFEMAARRGIKDGAHV